MERGLLCTIILYIIVYDHICFAVIITRPKVLRSNIKSANIFHSHALILRNKRYSLKLHLLQLFHNHHISYSKKCNHVTHEIMIILLSVRFWQFCQNWVHLFTSLRIFCTISCKFSVWFVGIEIIRITATKMASLFWPAVLFFSVFSGFASDCHQLKIVNIQNLTAPCLGRSGVVHRQSQK